MSSEINNIVQYAEALVRPLRVLVVDSEPGSFDKVAHALAPFDAEVFNVAYADTSELCLQKFTPFDLAFVGAPLSTFGTPIHVVTEIQRVCGEASVVIMARNLDTEVADIMGRGPFTFLKKNGSFNPEHIQKIASQLNLKLRPSGKAGVENQIPAVANVSRL